MSNKISEDLQLSAVMMRKKFDLSGDKYFFTFCQMKKIKKAEQDWDEKLGVKIAFNILCL